MVMPMFLTSSAAPQVLDQGLVHVWSWSFSTSLEKSICWRCVRWNVPFLFGDVEKKIGLSENSVPLNPMVLLIIIPTKWLFHWGYTPFSDIPK